jgi:sulfur carrier protein
VIVVNGSPVVCGEHPTIRDVLLGLDIDPETAGIAVAVDREVATRSDWPTRMLEDGARVEILTATQGG